eukprot:6485566-Amphidinium_carterae.1
MEVNVTIVKEKHKNLTCVRWQGKVETEKYGYGEYGHGENVKPASIPARWSSTLLHQPKYRVSGTMACHASNATTS